MDNAALLQVIRDAVREEMQEQIAPLREEMKDQAPTLRKEMQEQIAPLRGSLVKLEALPHQIGLLADAQLLANEKLDRLQGQVNSLETTIEHSVIVKAVTPSVL